MTAAAHPRFDSAVVIVGAVLVFAHGSWYKKAVAILPNSRRSHARRARLANDRSLSPCRWGGRLDEPGRPGAGAHPPSGAPGAASRAASRAATSAGRTGRRQGCAGDVRRWLLLVYRGGVPGNQRRAIGH